MDLINHGTALSIANIHTLNFIANKELKSLCWDIDNDFNLKASPSTTQTRVYLEQFVFWDDPTGNRTQDTVPLRQPGRTIPYVFYPTILTR